MEPSPAVPHVAASDIHDGRVKLAGELLAAYARMRRQMEEARDESHRLKRAIAEIERMLFGQ